MPTQQQQQQSSSEEGSKENAILNGPRNERVSAQGCPSWSADKMPQGQPLQHPQHELEVHNRLPQSTTKTEISRIHQNAMKLPRDPPEHLWMAKAQELPKQRRRHQNLALELWQVQVLLPSLLIHRRTLSYVQDVTKVATGAEIVRIIISVIFVEWPPTPHTCVELLDVEPVHQSVYTVAKLTMVLLIADTGLGTTGKSLDIHLSALKTGATSDNLAPVARNHTGSTHHNNNKTPFSPHRW